MTETPGINPTDGVPPLPPVAPVPPPAPPAPQYGAGPAYGAAPGYGAPQYVAAPAAPLSDSDQRLWATLAHIGPIILYFIAPLVIWLVCRARGRYVEDQAKEALNFQITLVISVVVVSILGVLTLGIGFLLLIPLFLVALVLMIIAAVAANKGEAYRYPLNIRFIK
jgi:uncharacterized Tic20 family protein